MKLPTTKELVNMTLWPPYICSISGLISGMFIAAFTEYVTSHTYYPVR
jgi:Na+/H+-translocating membrane pyrophosphatase